MLRFVSVCRKGTRMRCVHPVSFHTRSHSPGVAGPSARPASLVPPGFSTDRVQRHCARSTQALRWATIYIGPYCLGPYVSWSHARIQEQVIADLRIWAGHGDLSRCDHAVLAARRGSSRSQMHLRRRHSCEKSVHRLAAAPIYGIRSQQDRVACLGCEAITKEGSMPKYLSVVGLCLSLIGCVIVEPIGTCTDKTRNNDESDVDCGGSLCSGCDLSKSCHSGEDCKSGICSKGRCSSSCSEAQDCAGTDSTCEARSCRSGQCGSVVSAAGTRCGTLLACNGMGRCEAARCQTATDCGVTSQACWQPACNNGICAQDHAAAGTACREDGGTSCDGSGFCI